MQNEAGNEYSHRKTKGFVVKLRATQTATDNGAFDNVLNPTGITGDSYTFGYYNYSRNAETSTWTVTSCTLNETEKKQIKQAARMLESINGEPVVELGANLFSEFSALESVTLPKGLVTIGESAFYYCTNLSNINLGNCRNLKNISSYAFFCCSKLSNINLDKCNSLISIGQQAFFCCRAFNDGTLPSHVETIGTQAFMDCENIESFSLPVSLTSLDSKVFDYCHNLKHIYYDGTIAHWNALKKAPSWNGAPNLESIICSDGVIELLPAGNSEG